MYFYSADGKILRESKESAESERFGWYVTDLWEEQCFGWWLSELQEASEFERGSRGKNRNDQSKHASSEKIHQRASKRPWFKFYDISSMKTKIAQLIDDDHKILAKIFNISEFERNGFSKKHRGRKVESEVDSGVVKSLLNGEISDEYIENTLECIRTNKWNAMGLSDQKRCLTILAMCMEYDLREDAPNLSSWKQGPASITEELESKIRCFDEKHKKLFHEAASLQQDFSECLNTVSNLTSECRRLCADLQDIRYLDDLILLMQGDLDKISERRWPFIIKRKKIAHEELNFIV